MHRLDQSRSVATLSGVGPKRLAALEQAGVSTVSDLLFRLPRRYSDRRSSIQADSAVLAKSLDTGVGQVTVSGYLKGVKRVFTRRRSMSLVQGKLVERPGDGQSGVRCVWFNRPYLAKSVDESKRVVLSGSVRRGRSGIELLNPDIAGDEEPKQILAHYAPLAGLGDKALRRLVDQALGETGAAEAVRDPVPERLRRKRELPSLGTALEALHRPSAETDFEALSRCLTPAHQRMIYGDLYEIQLELARASLAVRGRKKPHTYEISDRVREVTRQSMPFRLTSAQRRCLGEIVADMKAPEPMLRLVQGDVGCGKTVVAAMAALVAAESGLQVAFLSPTEMLAEQLAAELKRLFDGLHGVGLLTGSSGDREQVLAELADGTLKMVSGTHALIQKAVSFDRLALVVIDEQHRFGVDQRMAMAAKGAIPDVLLMTATPIPRSLALAVFGDLELSTIDELPPGRGPVSTLLLSAQQRSRAVSAIERAVADGGRAFVVFPRIEESEAGTVSLDVEGQTYASLAGGRVARLTGQTEALERQRILRCFRSGEISVLLATTVIEVGIDVPDATLIVIEGAERFGLSQLHQLRGRIGRSGAGGRCLALHSSSCSDESLQRLQTFASTSDGFELAEQDLIVRGPGNLIGIEQSGFSQWSAERLAAAVHWLEAAREDAREVAQAELGSKPSSVLASDSRIGAG